MMQVRYRSLCAAASLLALSACGEAESAATGPTSSSGPALNEIVVAGPVNASSTDTLVYFSFETRGLVPRSSPWDIALRRFEVRVNGGVSGTAGATGYSFGNNRNATAAEVLALTNQNTLAAFDAIRSAQIPADSFFKGDRLILNANAFLNVGGGAPTANAAAYWKVRRANGGFALVRVTAIAFTGRALSSVTFESRLQTGATLGAPQAFTIATGSAPLSIDLGTGAAVTPGGCNWDLLLSPAIYEIAVNTACNVGTYPGMATPGFAGTAAAGDAPEYAPYLSVLTGPIPNSIEDVNGPFRYDLNNDQRLTPSFNTYLIRNGSRTYKLQVIGYYGTSGTGGFPTLRYARIQ
ncbi:MAG: HmuY family protein [Gemmatimonadaceae bacterium]|nr:HmuY family protein [Gemmatimonadaceae bacterium]